MRSPLAFPPIFFRGLSLFLWMGVIFFFSSLHGSEYQYEPTLAYYMERKGAHVIEYAVLMFLSVRFLFALFPQGAVRIIIIAAAAFSVTYGVSDELHQFFVPYRGAKLSDVAIDGLGILLAGAVIMAAAFLGKRRKA
ncbi:MAG: VanZ family protein [Patescibacteria group bacterium]